jgi:RimJ/RimL family protein N-acetyltransferase
VITQDQPSTTLDDSSATRLVWQTARDNHRAQAVYARVGATRDDRWLDYDLPVQPA